MRPKPLTKEDIMDFTDCKTLEDVNKKWIEYAKEVEPYKSLIKRLSR